jgi:hypothetical protein
MAFGTCRKSQFPRSRFRRPNFRIADLCSAFMEHAVSSYNQNRSNFNRLFGFALKMRDGQLSAGSNLSDELGSRSSGRRQAG